MFGMKWRLCIPGCSSQGFTVLEFLVGNTLGLMFIALTLSATLSNRRLYQHDLIRTRLNQNLRSALDIVGTNTREAGENLPNSFPAVEIVDGTGSATDELLVRRNLLDEVLKVCQTITAGSADTNMFFAVSGTIPGCIYSDQTHNYDTWRAKRLEEGGTVKAYIYDSSTGLGEFFEYVSESDSAPWYAIQRSTGTWQHDYNLGSAAVYLIEEWHFMVDSSSYENDVLQVVVDGDAANPLNIVFGINDFQVQAVMQDGSIQDTIPTGQTWADLLAVRTSLRGEELYHNNVPVEKELVAQFFPRNILSN